MNIQLIQFPSSCAPPKQWYGGTTLKHIKSDQVYNTWIREVWAKWFALTYGSQRPYRACQYTQIIIKALRTSHGFCFSVWMDVKLSSQ